MHTPSKNVGICGYGETNIPWLSQICRHPEIRELWLAKDHDGAVRFMRTDGAQFLLIRPGWEGEAGIDVPAGTVVIREANPVKILRGFLKRK
jgi:hypothetical protein